MANLKKLDMSDVGVEVLECTPELMTIRCHYTYHFKIYDLEEGIYTPFVDNHTRYICFEEFPGRVQSIESEFEENVKWHQYDDNSHDLQIYPQKTLVEYFAFIIRYKPFPPRYVGEYVHSFTGRPANIINGRILNVDYVALQREKSWIEACNWYYRNYVLGDQHRGIHYDGICIYNPSIYHTDDDFTLKILLDSMLTEIEYYVDGDNVEQFKTHESFPDESDQRVLKIRNQRKSHRIMITFSKPTRIEKHFTLCYR
jgi:hypothetical protein